MNLTNHDIENMSYQDRHKTLNKNPGLEARHFQYRSFFKMILLNSLLEKNRHYAEFQVMWMCGLVVNDLHPETKGSWLKFGC